MPNKAHSGVFHLLPLGLRIQNKLEALIDKHMQSIGASKVSLSSVTTETLWRQSGRYSSNSELLRIQDRKESKFLLAPTHEEEITALVAGMVHSYKDLPLRLYQIGRKYRDERRPRQGLLRAKEFMMKDLYTFDHSPETALNTYEAVRKAYTNLFNELKLPYLVADADSGSMGGKLSHEYHFVSPKGEDNVWSCSSCSYVANEELVSKKPLVVGGAPEQITFTGISIDRKAKIQISIPRLPWMPQSDEQHLSWDRISDYVNLHAVKRALPDSCDLDTSIEATTLESELNKPQEPNTDIHITDACLLASHPHNGAGDITVTRPGDSCPKCSHGTLDVKKAIEVGHTFHLGTRYSEPLNALVALADGETREPMHMGCHGIGVSRLIGAIASLLSDGKGLHWPRVIAPYEVVMLVGAQVDEKEALDVYDVLYGKGDIDLVLDDRESKSLGWKLKDADLVGYPVVVVVGKGWKAQKVEVQCRRLGVKKDVGLGGLRGEVQALLEQFKHMSGIYSWIDQQVIIYAD
ncbi:prolyl-tRNA synthetase [Phaeosphaeriaceae sp. PMI808]|nr:prolyl-tRNA synthetase [Phaeosphaeriaceae sp. PMI808]